MQDHVMRSCEHVRRASEHNKICGNAHDISSRARFCDPCRQLVRISLVIEPIGCVSFKITCVISTENQCLSSVQVLRVIDIMSSPIEQLKRMVDDFLLNNQHLLTPVTMDDTTVALIETSVKRQRYDDHGDDADAASEDCPTKKRKISITNALMSDSDLMIQSNEHLLPADTATVTIDDTTVAPIETSAKRQHYDDHENDEDAASEDCPSKKRKITISNALMSDSDPMMASVPDEDELACDKQPAIVILMPLLPDTMTDGYGIDSLFEMIDEQKHEDEQPDVQQDFVDVETVSADEGSIMGYNIGSEADDDDSGYIGSDDADDADDEESDDDDDSGDQVNSESSGSDDDDDSDDDHAGVKKYRGPHCGGKKGPPDVYVGTGGD